MKTRHLIILMVFGTLLMVAGLCTYIYIIVWTPILWGIRWDLVGLGLCGFATGVGCTLFTEGALGGIINTADKIKKKIDRHKTLKVIKKAKSI